MSQSSRVRRVAAWMLTASAAVACAEIVAPIVHEPLADAMLGEAPFTGPQLSMDVQPSSIHLTQTPTVNVILFSTSAFDASAVTVANVRFLIGDAGPGAPVAMRGTAPITSTRDYNGDGRTDRLFTFNTSALVAAGLVGGQPKLTLQDRTSASRQFQATDASPPTFHGGAAVLQNISGEPGEVAAGQTRTLRVRLVNASGGGVAGLRVRWDAKSVGDLLGSGGSSAMTTTDATGHAEVGWTIGAGPGGHRVVATAAGLVGSPIGFVGVVRESDGSIRVSPIHEPQNASTLTLGAEGGTVTATGANGVRYALVIPPAALEDPTSITLTPVADIPDAPLAAGSAFAVRMEPEGLKFTLPARLDVTLPSSMPLGRIAGFGYSEGGARFHLQPFERTGNVISFLVAHFSTEGGGSAEPALPEPVTHYPDVHDEESAMEAFSIIQQIAELTQNPPSTEALSEVFRNWYDRGLRPDLVTVGTVGDPFNRTISPYLFEVIAEYGNWLARMQRVSVDVGGRLQDAHTMLIRALKRGINLSLTSCVENEDLESAIRALHVTEKSMALGLADGSNGLSEDELKSIFCLDARVDPPAEPPQLKANQTTRAPFTPRPVWKPSAGVPSASLSAPSLATAPASALLSHGPRPSFNRAPAEIPLFVTITPSGTTDDTPQSAVVAPGGNLEAIITPKAGAASVTLTLKACLKVPNQERLDDVCEESEVSYPVAGDTRTGNFVVRNNVDAEALRGVTAIDGTLEITGSSILSLEPLNRLAKVTGQVTIGGDMPSLAGLEALREVGDLTIDRTTALVDLTGLNGLVKGGSIVMIRMNSSLTSLSGLQNLRELSGVAAMIIGSNPKLVEISAVQGVAPQIKLLGVSANLLLSDLTAFSAVTALPNGFFINGPAITTLASFGQLASLGNQTLFVSPDDLPKVVTFTLPALTQVQRILITTTRGVPSDMRSVSFPGLTSMSGDVMIEGADISSNPQPAIQTVRFENLVSTPGFAIRNNLPMTLIDFAKVNAPQGFVSISGNVGMPEIKIGTVGTVSIDNGAASEAPRLGLGAPIGDPPRGSVEDLTKISIAAVKDYIEIRGAENWSAFGPSIGVARQIMVAAVETYLNSPNKGKVCGWLQAQNVPDIQMFPGRKSVSTASVSEGQVFAPGNGSSSALYCF
jgi:hypothetical protein